MHKRTIIAIVSIGFVIAVVAAFAVQNTDRGIPHLEIRGHTVAGNELRLLVETSRSYYESLMSHSSTTADVKGYLITIDLHSTKPPTERSRVYGPLWEVPNPRSTISFTAGANFTKQDREAAAATPYCTFDVDGTLLSFIPDDSRKVLVRDAFVAAPSGGSWKRLGDVKEIGDDLLPMSEDRLETPSRRFRLIYRNGKAQLFNAFTGELKEDEWLTTCFAEARSIKDLNNVRAFLTEQLDYLVVVPMGGWNDGHGKTYETFDYDDKTHKRGEVGLVYQRAELKPVLYTRKYDAETFAEEMPRNTFSIDGRLYFFEQDELSIQLRTPDKSHEIRFDSKTPDWRLPRGGDVLHLPEANELVFFDTNDVADLDTLWNETVSVFRWNYRTNATSRVDSRILDLFNRRGGSLTPKSAIPVK